MRKIMEFLDEVRWQMKTPHPKRLRVRWELNPIS